MRETTLIPSLTNTVVSRLKLVVLATFIVLGRLVSGQVPINVQLERVDSVVALFSQQVDTMHIDQLERSVISQCGEKDAFAFILFRRGGKVGNVVAEAIYCDALGLTCKVFRSRAHGLKPKSKKYKMDDCDTKLFQDLISYCIESNVIVLTTEDLRFVSTSSNRSMDIHGMFYDSPSYVIYFRSRSGEKRIAAEALFGVAASFPESEIHQRVADFLRKHAVLMRMVRS
jgi:hypothetical protein